MPGKKALRLQDLEAEFETQTTTVKNIAPLTPEDVADRMALDIKKKQQAEDDIATGKSIMAAMHADGIVGDTFVTPSITLTWQTRESWSYSKAVKDLQAVERSDGTATRRVSESWVARPRPEKAETD